MTDELDDDVVPSGAGLIIPSGSPKRLFRAVQRMYERLTYTPSRQPTLQAGKDWLTSEDRLLLRGGSRGNNLDGFTDEFTMRSTTDGKRMDEEMGNGFTLLLPTRGGAIWQPTSFAMIINERRRAALTQRRQPQTTEGEEQPDNQASRAYLNRLDWDSEDPDEDTILNRLKSDAVRTAATEEGWLTELESFLGNTDAIRDLGMAYGGSVSTRWPRPYWARPDRGFDLERAVRGECVWHFSRNFPGRKLHEYDPFIAPPKEWVNRYMADWLAQQPTEQRRLLAELSAETKRTDLPLNRFGRGRLRHYGLAEVTELPTDSTEEIAQKRENRANAELRWAVWWNYDQALQYAYFTYIQEYKTSVVEHRQYLQDPVNSGQPLRVDGLGTTPVTLQSMSEEQIQRLWTTPAVRNPNHTSDEGYLGYFFQVPPTYQYAFWKQTETKIRFADERDNSFDGQTEAERLYAYYLVQRMFTWWEFLPRVDDRGVVHYKWYTDPTHADCNGCPHYNADPTLSSWIPAESASEVPAGWVYQEEVTWHPTRQAIQLLRKIMYTHNVGSHLSDIFSDLLLGPGDAKDFRGKYGGGGNERISPYEWWWPGATRSDTLNTGDPAATADYLASGLVARDFWLGPIHDNILTERARPYNGIWLKHHMLMAEVVESFNNFRDFLTRNRSFSGIADDDLGKELAGIKNFDTAIAFPRMAVDPNAPLGVRVRFSEKTPDIMFWEDTAGHVDPSWFRGRSAFSPETLEQLVEDFERSYQDWLIPGTTRFREGMEYQLTWPNGRHSRIESFRHEHFYKYLRVNWTNHETLARDFHRSQDPARFETHLKGRLSREETNGVFWLRPIINKMMDGLPLTLPNLDPHGNVKYKGGKKDVKLNDLGKLRAWAYQYADNQFYKAIILMARDRGVTFGQITSAVMDGYGQGYGSKKDQLRKIFNLYLIPLYCRYYDTWKGIVEKHGITHHAGIEGPSETWSDALEDIANAVKSRNLNWDFALEVSKDLKFFNVKIENWIHEHKPEASETLETTWMNHLKLISGNLNPHGGAKVVTALESYDLLAVPADPEKLLRLPPNFDIAA